MASPPCARARRETHPVTPRRSRPRLRQRCGRCLPSPRDQRSFVRFNLRGGRGPMADKKYENVEIEREGSITFVMLNRPDKRNAMSPGLHADMCDALETLATDAETRVLVLGGRG